MIGLNIEMSIPERCVDCALYNDRTKCCHILHQWCALGIDKLPNCPLVDDVEPVNHACWIGLDVEPTIGMWTPIKTRPMDEDERKEWSEKLGHKLYDDEAFLYVGLPDDGDTVLICLRSGNIMIDTLEIDDYGCIFCEHDDIEDVVAWMPLPEPWREEQR